MRRRSARLRPLRVPLLRSVSVPGTLGAVAGGGRTAGGRSACPRVGHALYQRGATEDEDILREIVQRCRMSGGGQSMGVARRPAGVRGKGLNECESEVKVVGVGAAADHPGGALEQDARRDGERALLRRL